MLGLSLAGTVVVVGSAIVAGSVRWNNATSRLVTDLRNSAQSTRVSQPRVSPDQYAALPLPVRRYFNYALTPGQKVILDARLQQKGVMRTDATAAWKPFTALEHFSTRRVGFVWDATMNMMPLLSVRIRDGYVDGAGASEASIVGLISVGKQGATPQVASGSLLRYLAESAWIPTALLPQSGVHWSTVDDTNARATLTDAGTTVTMDVAFDATGRLVRISAMRYRYVRGTPVLTPWSGHYTNYQRIEGMMVPTFAEAEWSPRSGTFSVWRGQIIKAEYEF